MCPSAPLSQPQAIDNQADDTEIFMHLRSMMQGAPSPVNVLSDVDPCKYAPWDLPSNFLYFLNSDYATSLKAEKGITTTEKGYWQVAVMRPSTLTRSPNTGTITALEFYRGQAPHGNKTVWEMYKYTIHSKSLGFSSLCKVFSRSDPSHTKEVRVDQQPILQSSEEGENNINLHICSEISPVLCRNLRPDISRGEAEDLIDSASSSSRSENTSMASWNSEECFDQEALLDELETPGTPDANPEYFHVGALLRDLETPAVTDDNPECFDAGALLRDLETPAATDDNPECFDAGALLRNLETPAATDANPECFDAGALLRDLETPAATDANPEYFDAGALLRSLETPAATDANPEYFDAEALVRSLETPAPMDTNLRDVDYMLNVDASHGSRQVLIQPLASDSIGSCGNEMPNMHVEETADSATMMSMQRKQDLNPTHSTASVVEERSDGMPSERGTAAHEVSQGPSTSQDSKVNGKRKAVVSRMAKVKKKFLCFMQSKFFFFF